MSNVFDIDDGIQPQQRVNVKLNDAQDVLCSACGKHFFHSVTFFKKISALMSPTGKEAIVPLETYACLECGNVNAEFLPTGYGQLNG